MPGEETLYLKSNLSKDLLNRPPDGCLQWLTGTDGKLTTFNFASSGGHLAGQNYNICIRKEAGKYIKRETK